MRRVLVTGGAGFIGSHLVNALLERGDHVIALDDLSQGNRSRLPPSTNPQFTFIRGDIRDNDVCMQASEGVDVVFHEAARVSVPQSIDDPNDTFQVNVQGTFQLLEAARQCGVRRFVYASSCAIYGDSLELPKSERMPCTPCSPYASSKSASEQMAQSYHAAWGLETVGLRYFNVFGPGQDPSGAYAAVIAAFVTRCLNGDACTIFGNGEQTRDFVYVGDVVRANLLAAESPSERAAGNVYNIGSGNRITIRNLYETIAAACGIRRAPRFAPPRSGDVLHSLANIGTAYSDLSYLPKTCFEEGIEATVQWYRSHAAQAPRLVAAGS